MIGYLLGKPLLVDDDLIVVTGGVGYQVAVTAATLQAAAALPEIELFIYTHVREEALQLFGFRTYQEKKLFALTLGVSGVGPTIALSLVAAGSSSLIEAVQEAKVSFFTAIPRVGKKLAQKIIIDLRGKLGELKALELSPLTGPAQDVIATLVTLGFDQDRVVDVVNTLDIATVGVEKGVKAALKKIQGNT